MENNLIPREQLSQAEGLFATYNFGEGFTVAASKPFTKDTFDGKDDYTKVVYVECADDDPETPSHRVSFHAAFKVGTTQLIEAYAYWCENGCEMGPHHWLRIATQKIETTLAHALVVFVFSQPSPHCGGSCY